MPNDHSHTYCYYLYSDSKSYGHRPRFIHRDSLPRLGFASLYAVTKDTAEAIEQAGTTKGFKGVVWSETLEVDVDSYSAAEAVAARLSGNCLEFMEYDSGGKGHHFSIRRNSAPSHLLPYADKEWVKHRLPEGDCSIYTHLHPFRLEGTVHESTGSKKKWIQYSPGKTLNVPVFEFEEVATPPLTGSSVERSIFDMQRVMANSIPQHNGERHAALVRLLYALKETAQVDPDTARWWVGEVNKMFEEPKSEEEIWKLVQSIYRG